MTFSQMLIFVSVCSILFCVLDFVLGKVKKDWKLTKWEEEERGFGSTSSTNRDR